MTNKTPPYLPSLGRLLAFADRKASALSDRELAEHGLTLAHWVVLTALWRNDGMSVGDLAAYTKSSYGVLSRTLDRMEARDLVERQTNPQDHRGVYIFLTDKAKGLAHLRTFYEQINMALLAGFSPEEEERLFGYLERIIANAEAQQ